MKHIRIHLKTSSTVNKTSVPNDTSYWKKLWDTYTSEYASVEIQCWQEEVHDIEELTKLSAHSVNQGLVKSFTITLNEKNCNYLRNHSIDADGGLKWFTIFFYKEDIQMLEIAQYGSEIVLYGVNEKEAEEFEALFPEIENAEYFKEHLM
ncbi:hypothetical protein HMPREF1210_00034 [Paenisporosarcina sp. HGH0030]|uniref:hypothetical protein n=1 Tax=Paenisporosarcina sp. HGH0030 TaxID=1078085 RepID=UPI00034E51AC|nr:hypothetical protein [Paenisporosarcina sp. HGH0030]EPD54049.1 hypothetical protein HMPREF1210_00034 [Paenisporosarcina sp. HGH0030]